MKYKALAGFAVASLFSLLQSPAYADHIEISSQGTVTVTNEDYFPSGITKARAFLTETDKKGKKTGRKFELRFSGGQLPAGLISGAKVKIHGGIAHGKKNIVDLGAGGLTTTSSGAVVAASGTDSVLVLRVTSGNGSPSCSTSALASTMQHVADLNSEASYGKFSYAPIAAADVTINFTDTACDWGTIASLADQAYGSGASTFKHRVYVFMGAGCGWAGLGYMPGGQAWINGSYCGTSDIYAHELGHNIALHHASTDTNNDGTLDCEYCDTSDYMGYGGVGDRHPNGAHKVQEGWASAVAVSSPGSTFTLPALETTSTSSVLKITPSTGAPYFISYRAALGSFSSGLPSGDRNRTAVVRHSGGSSQSLKITTLGDGQSFTDAAEGVTITQNSHTATDANVSVTWGCVKRDPTVTLAPALGGTNVAGSTVDFTLTVKNNDGVACAGGSLFNLSNALPAGLQSAAFDSTTLTLSPGQSGQTALHVTSGAGTANGDFAFSAAAASTGHATISGSATYRIDSQAPSIPASLTVSKRKSGKKIIATLSWGASTDNFTGVTYIVSRNGTVIGQGISTLNFQDTLSASGTYNYTVKAKDALGNLSGLSNQVSVVK